MARILVTGGCGYIGSHTIVDLLEHGYEVVCADNLSRSTEQCLAGMEAITGNAIKNHQVDFADRQATQNFFSNIGQLDGIIHFAAFKSVPESVAHPALYYRNNMNSLLNILEYLAGLEQAPHLVFSSSCSVYGNVDQLPVTEDTPLAEAESPYGHTKQMGEEMIQQFCRARGQIKSIILRYFNPVGAHPSGLIGEYQVEKPENLVPYITQTAIGKREVLSIFGSEYNTKDGTCIRDYIHVMDIAHAHTLAFEYLKKAELKENPSIFNLGTGDGVSVLDVVKAFEQATGVTVNKTFAPNRPGDVVAIYANNDKARALLGWAPAYSLQDMMQTAWKWEQQLANLST